VSIRTSLPLGGSFGHGRSSEKKKREEGRGEGQRASNVFYLSFSDLRAGGEGEGKKRMRRGGPYYGDILTTWVLIIGTLSNLQGGRGGERGGKRETFFVYFQFITPSTGGGRHPFATRRHVKEGRERKGGGRRKRPRPWPLLTFHYLS